MQANIRRVGLVIKVRWALVVVLAVFSLIAAWAYTLQAPAEQVLRNMAIPAATLAFVLLYNTSYQVTYRRLGNIAFLNDAQLLFDALVTTVIVYYSGGVYSWFATMYLLIILEAALILPRRHLWYVAAACAGLYGLIVWPEYYGWLPHVDMPFVNNQLQHDLTYVSVRFFWQVTVMLGTATVGTLIMTDITGREAALRRAMVRDETTGLCDRAYFQRALAEEVEHSAREDRQLAVVLVDVDHFGDFNALFGLEAGDTMLRAVAAEISTAVAASASARAWPESLVCRFGGEEFAALLPGANESTALAVAERVRAAVAGLRVAEGSVTVSVGVAVYPQDAGLAEDLLDAADQALSAASDEVNRIFSASAVRAGSVAVVDA